MTIILAENLYRGDKGKLGLQGRSIEAVPKQYNLDENIFDKEKQGIIRAWESCGGERKS